MQLVVARWLWARRSLPARLARLALLPPSLLYRAIAAARVRAYRAHLLHTAIPSVPTVAVGNLTVGGSGKTPLAAWIGRYYAKRGRTPGIVLRGYGGDEGAVHRALAGAAVVIENPDRMAGARTAIGSGADVIILDDAFQRLDVGRDLNIAVVSAESSRAAPWTLPAGPWREGWPALRRADFVVVTRKRAHHVAAAAIAHRVHASAPRAQVSIARLGITGFTSLVTRRTFAANAIDGFRVVASAGVADPDSFGAQCRGLGADVRLLPWPDHYDYPPRDLVRLLHAARDADYVVMTEKDAVKIRQHWPLRAPEPLVATLGIAWEAGQQEFEMALDTVIADVDDLVP